MKKKEKEKCYTKFYDMHSGGDQKLEWSEIYIEAPKEQAKLVFYNRFGRNPERVTCTCCGEDYSITEYNSLEQAMKYSIGKQTVEEYCKSKDVLVIPRTQIESHELQGEIPEQGYVWKD